MRYESIAAFKSDRFTLCLLLLTTPYDLNISTTPLNTLSRCSRLMTFRLKNSLRTSRNSFTSTVKGLLNPKSRHNIYTFYY